MLILILNNLHFSESFNVNEPSMTKKPINSFDQIRTQNEEESKENVMPPNELDDIELTIVQKLKNEEDTSDSLKSLDGNLYIVSQLDNINCRLHTRQ